MNVRYEVDGLDGDFGQVGVSPRSLLLLWSAIERAARDEVARVNDGIVPKSAHGIAALLNAWEDAVIAGRPATSLGTLVAKELRTVLGEHLRTRNGICHGLEGVSSAHDGKPATLTWTINGEKRGIEWDDLQASFTWLSRAPRAIFTISNSTSDTIGNRLTDDPGNREWWLTEFGLDVSRQYRGHVGFKFDTTSTDARGTGKP